MAQPVLATIKTETAGFQRDMVLLLCVAPVVIPADGVLPPLIAAAGQRVKRLAYRSRLRS